VQWAGCPDGQNLTWTRAWWFLEESVLEPSLLGSKGLFPQAKSSKDWSAAGRHICGPATVWMRLDPARTADHDLALAE